MKRLDRYVIREMIVPLLIGTVAVSLMFHANLLIALYKTLDMQAVPISAVLKLLLLKTPFFLNLTLPVGLALASSLTMSRLARESEVTAMRSAGIPVRRIIAPILVIGVLIAGLNYYIAERVMPGAEKAAYKLQSEAGTLALSPQIKSNVVVTLKRYTAMIGNVTKSNDGQIILDDITLIERLGNHEMVIITAESGEYDNGVWSIKEPYWRNFKGKSFVSAKSDQKMTISEPISIPELFLPPEPQMQSIEELKGMIAQQEKLKRETRMLEVTLHVRYSIPAACILFAITGATFAFTLTRSGPFVGVLISILMVLVYWNLFIISTEIVGRYGWLPPVAAAWLPNALFLVISLLALRKME